MVLVPLSCIWLFSDLSCWSFGCKLLRAGIGSSLYLLQCLAHVGSLIVLCSSKKKKKKDYGARLKNCVLFLFFFLIILCYLVFVCIKGLSSEWYLSQLSQDGMGSFTFTRRNNDRFLLFLTLISVIKQKNKAKSIYYCCHRN